VENNGRMVSSTFFTPSLKNSFPRLIQKPMQQLHALHNFTSSIYCDTDLPIGGFKNSTIIHLEAYLREIDNYYRHCGRLPPRLVAASESLKGIIT
jgi:hypothetical protein